jgi:hexosaminidase
MHRIIMRLALWPLLAIGCRGVAPPAGAPSVTALPPRVIPAPASLAYPEGEPFAITVGTRIVVSGGDEATQVGETLAALLRKSTGYPLVVADTGATSAGNIRLTLAADRGALGGEGYELNVSREAVRITAFRAAGLFHGMQTLRQLLPPSIESEMKIARESWPLSPVAISDVPRFPWRGAMLDVARHFFTVREVRQYIDILALYKLNVLHLHLADDQGWRIEIKSRPRLTTVGAATQVGGGEGGFFSQEEYAGLVRYAQERHVTIVPEIDMPGHSNAALTAYPELSCGARPPGLYAGTDVGWSTLCVDKEETYALVDDVVRELAALTPGSFIHIGGDEVEALTAAQYAKFIERVQGIVARHGKRMIGWEEIAKARLDSSSVAQQWKSDSVVAALRHGAKVILSPAPKSYLDMKYTPATELGLHWAGYVEVRDAYDWNPAVYIPGLSERDVLGVEAPLWSETVRNITAVEYMALPRLPAIAEVGWTPQPVRDWEDFRLRLATHAPRWRYLGVNYNPSAQIPW